MTSKTDIVLTSIPKGGNRIGVGRSKTYELINDGELETVNIGKRRLIVVASIDAYVERLRGLAEPDPKTEAAAKAAEAEAKEAAEAEAAAGAVP